MNGLVGHGAPVRRFSRSVLPPSEVRSSGLVPSAASPVPTSSDPSRSDQQSTTAVPAVAGGEAADQLLDLPRPRRPVVQAPGEHVHLVAGGGGAALAGVEAAVARELRIHLQRHQAGLAGDPHPAAREPHPAGAAVLPDRQRRPVALGEQQPVPADGLHVPGVVEAGDLPVHVQRGYAADRYRGIGSAVASGDRRSRGDDEGEEQCCRDQTHAGHHGKPWPRVHPAAQPPHPSARRTSSAVASPERTAPSM